MVPVVLETTGNGADVDQAVGLHHDEARRERAPLGVAAKQAQLHALAQQTGQIAHARILCLLGISHLVKGLPVGRVPGLRVLVDDHPNHIFIPRAHDGPPVGRIGPRPTLGFRVVAGQGIREC